MEEAINTLHEVADSLQGRMVHVGSFLERVETALQRLPLAQAPMAESSVGFMDEAGAELYGSFSPRVGSSSTPRVLTDFEGEATVEVVSPVLQIMPELQVLCGAVVENLFQLCRWSSSSWTLSKLHRWTWCPPHPPWSFVGRQTAYLSTSWSTEF